jgi:superkiller protein 3
MSLRKLTLIVLSLLILASCAGLLTSPSAKQAFEKGLSLFNQGKYVEAIPHFQKATEIEPEYVKAYIYLGRSHLNLGQWLEAIPPLRAAYSLSPSETKKEVVNLLLDSLIGAALEALKKGNFKDSVSMFKEALDIDPASADVQNGLVAAIIAYGGQLLSEGRLTEAVSQYTEAIQLSPDNLNAYLGLARAYLKNGDFLNSMKTINKARSIAPTDTDRSIFQDLMNQ